MLMGSQLDFDYGEEYMMKELYSTGRVPAEKPFSGLEKPITVR